MKRAASAQQSESGQNKKAKKSTELRFRPRLFHCYLYRPILIVHNEEGASRFAAGYDRKPLFPCKTTTDVLLSKSAAFAASNQGVKAVKT
jgi:hypothetical protein